MAKTDTITLTGVRARGFHGVLPEETRMGQEFSVDITAHVDLTRASRSDDLAHTINYAELAQIAYDAITGEPKQLIEALAGGIADQCMAQFPAIADIAVTVHKPAAPIPLVFDNVAVTITRRRDTTRDTARDNVEE
ncbi:Dihydroneopterin aldolase [Corynebacterium renale]|uniref:7,8-dihydroneopterin aldolase n=1 Tax=Corynebacterium renale TaxID=1724 RepID=A0A2A9DNM5_9CORY|nr:dihydroneopterin aldolase [Corynebacterium renale]PFG27991.1 dihydroneopterin aldolase [Corynebacterium renale]SQG63286.1 Dihydroneopterin aldolase [Corynebacterium renale]SQI21459.1 Dihydroneopterin aldolase [Corynebacterium renale]STC99353.1 Dihydroneopterin aldolase [Corynebacterium renale]